MRAVLCNSCSHIDVNKIAENLNCDVEIVETCTEVNADLVSCPVLSSDARVVDLRLVEKVFHNPEKVALSWMSSELITSSPEYSILETGYDIVYVGSNPEVVRILGNLANVAVVTESEETVTELYPFRHRIFYGKVRNITGEIGRLKVTVEGEDLLKERQGIFEIECGMAIIPPDARWSTTGVIKYDNEYRSVAEAFLNLGSIKVLKSVKVDTNMCATEKSGIPGCSLCLRCPNSSVRRVNGEIVIDYLSCLSCGYCTSVCPTGAAQSTVLPSDALIKKIDLAESGTVVFICEKALGGLHSLAKKGIKLPEAHIITVPCLNYVSDVHYLYTVLRGNYAVGVQCDCRSGMYGGFVDLANEILSAFGYPRVEITDVQGLPGTLYELKNRHHPGKIIESADSSGRSLMAAMLAKLSSRGVRGDVSTINTDRFAEINISDSCAFCKTCQAFCPTGAIRREPDESRIYFNHALCISCRLCERACPEKAITVKQGLNLESLSETAVFETEMVECPSCGKKHISKKTHERLSQLLGLRVSTMYCEDCRPKMILETIYKEIKGDEK